jgi:hypothetical protein
MNQYLWIDPENLAGMWSMRAAELMPDIDACGEQVPLARDTAYMLLAGAVQVAPPDNPFAFVGLDASDSTHDGSRERRVRFEVLKRAAFVAIPEHPERWLMNPGPQGFTEIHKALGSDEGLCEVLRHLQQIACIGGRWHTINAGTS